MKIRVIIPCFNEGKVVKKTYDRLTEILTENSKTRRYYYDLLFIDDGSKDNTIEH
ncbi:MAG: glycosyltransferase, partial [Staphylococcus sp.]|nr:glycosyltransferase [Staphylococcus sp.]